MSELKTKLEDIQDEIETKIIPSNIAKSVKIFNTVGTFNGLEEKDVNFYDYDDKLVYAYSKNEFLALKNMPENPEHDGLIAQGWNWTLLDAQDYVTSFGKLDIGQVYIPKTKTTEIDIELTPSTLKGAIVDINGTKDWRRRNNRLNDKSYLF